MSAAPSARAGWLLLLASLGSAFAATQAVRGQLAGWDLKAPAPVADGRPATLARANEVKCGECHREALESWAATTHALAWENEPYQEDLVGRKKAESCHGCHAPVALHGEGDLVLAQKPEARKDERHFGVSCESCHLATDGALLGPTGAATQDHATRRAESFVGAGSDALCATCHRTTVGPVLGLVRDFEQWETKPEGATCVGCHMAPLREVGEGEAKRIVRSHALQTPRDPHFLAQAFGLSLETAERSTKVVITNRAGHRVPGLIGRELEFSAVALGADGKELARETLVLTTEAYLPVGGSLSLELPVKAAKVTLRARHVDPRLDKPVLFLERELAP